MAALPKGGGRPWLPYAATSNVWTAEMDPLEWKSASIGSTSPEGLGIMGPKSSTTSMPSKVMLDWLSSSCSKHHCLLVHLVDMPVDIPSSTSWAGATTWAVDMCWREVHEVMTQSQWRIGRFHIQIEIRTICKKNGYRNAGWIWRTIDVEKLHNILIQMMHSFEWDMLESIPVYNADLWNLPARTTRTIWLSQNKMHCSSKQQ
jgi:hypothetical protein